MGNAIRASNASIDVFRSRMAAWLGFTHQGRRDTYEVFGYPKIVQSEMLYNMYARQDLANRIVRAFPQATWREMPVIRDEAGDSSEKDTEGYSPFVEAVENFFEEKRIPNFIERADRLSGVGRYGILIMGFQDGQPLRTPLEEGNHKLIYLQPFGEPNVNVNSWDQDETSPRYGLPEAYTANLGATMQGDRSIPGRSFQVHHTRVIHLSEFLEEDGVYGMPRLLPVYNRLLDLEKVVGGSAETFWLTANRGLGIWADKEAQLTEDDIKDMKKQADEFQHQLRRVLVGTGMTAQSLGSEDPDPGPNAEKLLDIISGATGIPKRILIGSERGELSSTQDENNWAGRIDERRHNYGTPMILRPFINLMIETGNLPRPKGKWWVEWPQVSTISQLDESNIILNKTNALAVYANAPNAEYIVPRQEFRKDIMGLDPESDYDLPDEASLLMPDEIPDVDPVEDETGDPELSVNAKPRTLYACRRVLNAGAILKWAKSQGFKGLVKPEDMHVTIHYTDVPIDWMKIGGPYVPNDDDSGRLMVPPGGVRIVEALGDEGYVCLLFTHNELSWRHQEITMAGATDWKWGTYQPHVTFAKGEQKMNLELVEPYTGPIALGPEEFRENNPPQE